MNGVQTSGSESTDANRQRLSGAVETHGRERGANDHGSLAHDHARSESASGQLPGQDSGRRSARMQVQF